MKNKFNNVILILMLLGVFAGVGYSQTTAFTYQGSLQSGGSPASGSFDLQFALYDAPTGGTQQGSTISMNGVTVSNGSFSVSLDFGNQFSGADRFLEIQVRQAGGGAYTTLSPRQAINSTPYAITASIANAISCSGCVTDSNITSVDGSKVTGTVANATNAVTAGSANGLSCSGCVTNGQINSVDGTKVTGTVANAANAATAADSQQLGGVAASQYVQTNDPRMSNERQPVYGSTYYIQNGTDQQPADFNISGNGRVGSTFTTAGLVASSATVYNTLTTGALAVGSAAVTTTSTGSIAVGTGTSAVGDSNMFFGSLAGQLFHRGSNNAYFGARAGLFSSEFLTQNSSYNSFFGAEAGYLQADGVEDTYIGYQANRNASSGSQNTAVGAYSSTWGPLSTAIGMGASAQGTNATAIGANVVASCDNCTTLASKVGIGTPNPTEALTVKTGSSNYGLVHTDGNIKIGTYVGGAGNGGYFGTKSNHPLYFFVNDGGPILSISLAGFVGVGTTAPTQTFDVNGSMRVRNLYPTAGASSPLCTFPDGTFGLCGASSLRWKKNVHSLEAGLNVVKRLRPIGFEWKKDGTPDIGLAAEEVAKVDPSLTFKDDKGVVSGVRYDRLNILLINAVKEQQAEIEALKALVCQKNKKAAVCKSTR